MRGPLLCRRLWSSKLRRPRGGYLLPTYRGGYLPDFAVWLDRTFFFPLLNGIENAVFISFRFQMQFLKWNSYAVHRFFGIFWFQRKLSERDKWNRPDAFVFSWTELSGFQKLFLRLTDSTGPALTKCNFHRERERCGVSKGVQNSLIDPKLK